MSAALEQENLVVAIRREIAEAGKLPAEERELMHGGDKLRFDLWLGPVIAPGGIAIGILGLLLALNEY
jgi:hypothetical protein